MGKDKLIVVENVVFVYTFYTLKYDKFKFYWAALAEVTLGLLIVFENDY